MQLTTLFIAVLATGATAFPVWNPVIVRSPTVEARQDFPPPTKPQAPSGTGYPPGPTGTGIARPIAMEARQWTRPAAPPKPAAPVPVGRSTVPVYPQPNAVSARAPAPWFAAV